jgi:hypothetical protein
MSNKHFLIHKTSVEFQQETEMLRGGLNTLYSGPGNDICAVDAAVPLDHSATMLPEWRVLTPSRPGSRIEKLCIPQAGDNRPYIKTPRLTGATGIGASRFY